MLRSYSIKNDVAMYIVPYETLNAELELGGSRRDLSTNSDFEHSSFFEKGEFCICKWAFD